MPKWPMSTTSVFSGFFFFFFLGGGGGGGGAFVSPLEGYGVQSGLDFY